MSGTNGTHRLPVQVSRVELSNDVPPWLKVLRRTVQEKLTPDALGQIVESEIDRARKGDRNSRDFVFNVLLGGTVPRLMSRADERLDLE